MSESQEARPLGRPVILEDEKKRTDLIAAVSLGMSLRGACRYVGIRDLHTLRDYRKTHPDFDQQIQRAEAKCELWHLDNWRRGAEGLQSDKGNDVDWRASMEFLGRKFPKRWSAKQRHEVTGKNGGPIQSEEKHDLSGLSVDELIALRAIKQKIKTTNDDGDVASAAGSDR